MSYARLRALLVVENLLKATSKLKTLQNNLKKVFLFSAPIAIAKKQEIMKQNDSDGFAIASDKRKQFFIQLNSGYLKITLHT